ncbi:MAG: acyl-ACP--UDP-N-acetylglucosamine O-acyltransferase [Alphaproteobacteria bacterium]|nr:acyl-ACP--UDP-N-acetylglucosamine O-acyltransferase [Alphaproteobacteria bacterium]
MTSTIHPTAVIDSNARIGNGVNIGAYCVIGPDVWLHDNVTLKPHVVLDGDTEIGSGTIVYSFASIGAAPQDLKYNGEKTKLVIGKNNVIREHVTMNPGTVQGGGETRVGDNSLFMVGVHVAHDCQLGNNIVMANNATLAGHVHVGNNVIIGGLSAVHQWIRIGDFAIIGGMSGVENDVIPFGRVKGERAFLDGLNIIGMERNGFTKDQIKAAQRAFNELFGEQDTLEQRLQKAATDYASEEAVMRIVEFARNKTKFPLCAPSRKQKAA